MSKSQLESIWKETVVRNLAILGQWSFARICIFPYTLLPLCPAPWCTWTLIWECLAISDHRFLRSNQTTPSSTSHLYTRLGVVSGLEPYPCHSTTSESRTWALYLAALGGYFSPVYLHPLSNLSPVTCCLVFPFSSPPFFVCTFLQNHLHPLPTNPFSIMIINKWQPGLKYRHKICNCRLPMQVSISNLFQSVLPMDNGPILLFEKPHHPYFLPLVECTKVGLRDPFGKLLQGELCLLQANWGFAFRTSQVRRNVALISCIIFLVQHLQQWGQVRNPCDIYFPRCRW